ncbi:MAG TPA: NPCBM/NEW2 domain-containing protein [Isosphaeraceae bacterium]|nr:NPCBM/NEW2 domain-containing protein [Isosphaeraceae bacterium]
MSCPRSNLHSLCTRTVVPIFLAAGFLLAPQAASPAAGASTSSDPVFTALLIDGRTLAGRILSLGPKAIRIQSADGTSHELPRDRLVKLSRETSLPLPLPDFAHVILPDGDRIMRVAIGSTTDTDLELKSDVLGNLPIPLDALLGVVMSTPALVDTLDAWWDRVLVEPRSTEVVWLANGDRLAGGFLGLDDKRLKIQVEGKPAEVERGGIVAIGFDPALVNYPRPESGFIEVTLRDGTRLGVQDARLQDNLVVARTRFGRTIRFPLGELSRIHARSSAVVYLTERKPITTKYIPYVGPIREYRSDRSVRGRVFRLAGQSFDRGIGTQSRTFLAYEIEPGDRRFQASIGVDEEAGPLGSVVFRVFTDSNERYKSPPLTETDSPQAVDIDLAGAKRLILITEYGDRGDVRDLADWVEARIIR